MVIINTSEDIIRALREDPDLLDQVRRAILTDEFMELPGLVAQILETQNEMLKAQNEMRAEIVALTKTQDEMRAGIVARISHPPPKLDAVNAS